MWKSYLNAGLPIRTTLNADPEPDSAFNFNADPVLITDPASRQSDGNLRPLDFRPSKAPFWACSIASVHSPPRLCVEPLKLLKFYFNADPKPDQASEINADLDQQLCLNVWR